MRCSNLFSTTAFVSLCFQIHVVSSAGNSARDACRASPASASSGITVAAVDPKLKRWSMGNYGGCVDVFAPGVNIMSAVSHGDDAAGLKTGTSMAAPFVTGKWCSLPWKRSLYLSLSGIFYLTC